MTPQELKNSILQLAIQGKLVEQRPEEGTAEELYRQIQAEKQALVKAGKNKKEKPLPEITEDEVPFEIPVSWMWVRLGKAFSTIMGQSPDGNNVTDGGTGMEFHQGKICFSDMMIGHSPQTTNTPTKIAPAHSLLLCVRAPVGKVNITDRELCIGRGLSAIVCHADISVSFAFYWFQTLESIFVRKSTGTTFKAISADIINNQVIPLPPLAEQKRIVAKIEELLPYIDRYEKAWSRLEDFNKRFRVDMQKSILQLAIQGKLVEQRHEEGTGEELYRQIQAEKQALVKAGKIKKEKPLPEIAEDEVPFEIPESWKWVRLNNMSLVIVDCPHSTPQYYDYETGYYAIGTKCMTSKGEISRLFNIDEDTYYRRIERLAPQEEDIVYSREGSIVCRAVLLPKGEKICLGQRVMLIRCPDGISPLYIQKYLMADQTVAFLTQNYKGVGVKHINVADVCALPVPLPPLAEQKRIVAKLEELLPLCERLK